MSYLTKFTSAVQGAVSNVSEAVSSALQDEIAKSYEMPKDNTASGGHECLWKIYPAISKKTGQEMSIFIFDKDDIRKQPKEIQERIIDVMRTDMKTLRILRHPHVLKVEEVFEETKRIIAFVTEKVTCSIANANKRFDNVANVTPDILEVGLSEFEVACGLMHLGEALSFLHREGKRVHLSISPQSVFITPKGEWKLAGLGFCRQLEGNQTSRSEYYTHDIPRKDKVPPLRFEPPLEYCAPELVTEPRQFSSLADMFSLGLVVYELFLPPGPSGSREPVIDARDGNPMTHGYKVQSLHPINFQSCVPTTLHNTIRSLLSIQPQTRADARTFLASPFFDAGPVKTLRLLQALVEHDPSEQAKFLSDLPKQLEGFPPRILRDMVIPGLEAAARNRQVAPFAIPSLLKVVEILDKFTVQRMVSPMLAPLLAITEPVQVMLMFSTNLHVLVPKSDDGFIRDHVVPMLCRALDSNVPEILDTVLNKIVDQANLFEYRILKQVILPRVTKLILQPPQMSVRVNALLWLAKSYHVFDKDLLVESVLPTLTQCLAVDKSPAVCMCILGCYDSLGKHLGPDFIARNILPAICPLLVERTLNGKQFDLVCQRVQSMLQEVIQERDKQFMAESSVKSMTSGLEQSAGISAAVSAANKSKEETSGTAAADKLLEETAKQPYDYKKSPEADQVSDDPFILGSKKSSGHGIPTSKNYENADDDQPSYAERRRVKKSNRKKATKKSETSDLLDIAMSESSNTAQPANSLTTNTNNMFNNLTIASSAPMGSVGLSSGGSMSMSTMSTPNTGLTPNMPMTNTLNVPTGITTSMPVSNPNSMGGMSAPNSMGIAQNPMSTYGGQQPKMNLKTGQPMNASAGGNMFAGMSVGGTAGMGMNSNYGNVGGMNSNYPMQQPGNNYGGMNPGMSGFGAPMGNNMMGQPAGPGQLLQIQGGYNQQNNNTNSQGKFSAFDGL